MVGSFGNDRQRHGGAVGVFEAAGDGLGDEHMSDEMSQAAWAQAWETYQRRKKENEERDAFRAGYQEAQQEIRREDALGGSLPSRAAYGTFAWAAQQMQDGRKVKRKVGAGYIGGGEAFALGPWDVLATDWELYWPESEAPDSPCDSP